MIYFCTGYLGFDFIPTVTWAIVIDARDSINNSIRISYLADPYLASVSLERILLYVSTFSSLPSLGNASLSVVIVLFLHFIHETFLISKKNSFICSWLVFVPADTTRSVIRFWLHIFGIFCSMIYMVSLERKGQQKGPLHIPKFIKITFVQHLGSPQL